MLFSARGGAKFEARQLRVTHDWTAKLVRATVFRITCCVAYHLEEGFQEAAEFGVSIDFGNVVRLLSVAVGKLTRVAGVWQVGQLSTQFFEAEFGCKVDQRWQLEIFLHCVYTRTKEALKYVVHCWCIDKQN